MTNVETSNGAVLITGASSGIGRTTALALDAHGFVVFPEYARNAMGMRYAKSYQID